MAPLRTIYILFFWLDMIDFDFLQGLLMKTWKKQSKVALYVCSGSRKWNVFMESYLGSVCMSFPLEQLVCDVHSWVYAWCRSQQTQTNWRRRVLTPSQICVVVSLAVTSSRFAELTLLLQRDPSPPHLSWREGGLSDVFLTTQWMLRSFLRGRRSSGWWAGRFCFTHRGPLRLSGTCRAFTMACIGLGY